MKKRQPLKTTRTDFLSVSGSPTLDSVIESLTSLREQLGKGDHYIEFYKDELVIKLENIYWDHATYSICVNLSEK